MIRPSHTLLRTLAFAVSIAGGGCRENSRIGIVEATDASAPPPASDGGGTEAAPSLSRAGQPVVFAQGHPWIYEMELDATDLYWVQNVEATPTAEVWRAPRAGGPATRLVEGPEKVYGLALDEEYVYFVRTPYPADGSVWRIAKRGGQPERLLDGAFNPTSIAVDRTHVYFNAAAARGGEVRRIPKGGGSVELIAALDGPWDIAVDETALYVSEQDRRRIVRMPKQGGTPQVLASDFGTDWLRVHGDLVYFSACELSDCLIQKLWRVPVNGGAVELVHEGTFYTAGKIAVAPGVVLWGAWLLPAGADPVRFSLGSEKEIGQAVAVDERGAYVAEYLSGRILTIPLAPGAQ